MCFLCRACSVYFHIFTCKERVQCSLGGEVCVCVCGGGGANFLTIRWKCSRWSRSICFLVSSPAPTKEQRAWWSLANPLGFINDYFLGRIFHPPIKLQKTLFVIATLETLGYFSTMTATFWHWKNELSVLTCNTLLYYTTCIFLSTWHVLIMSVHDWTLVKIARSSLIVISTDWLSGLLIKGGSNF